MKSKDKIEFILPDRYIKSAVINPADDSFIGAIKYIRDQGKTCEFLGFNQWNCHVVLVDGIKYYVSGRGSMDTINYVTLFVVGDEEHDYIENHLKKRENQILQVLENN